jgi:hypothetical protein
VAVALMDLMVVVAEVALAFLARVLAVQGARLAITPDLVFAGQGVLAERLHRPQKQCKVAYMAAVVLLTAPLPDPILPKAQSGLFTLQPA